MHAIGIAYYLHPQSPINSPAWVCIDEGVIERRVHPVDEPGIIWFTNLELSAVIEWDLDSHHVKRNDFFAGGLTGLFKELGTDLRDLAKNGEGLSIVSSFLTKLARFIDSRDLGASIAELPRLSDLTKTFNLAITESSKDLQLYNQAFIGSYKHTYRNDDPAILGSGERVTFRFPKGAYALHLANRPMPGEAWNEVEPDGECSRTFLSYHSLHSVGFVRVRAKKSDADSLTLIHLGEPTGQWLAIPEAYEISKRIELKVDLAIISEPAENPLKPIVNRVQSISPITLLTFSAGLILESAWGRLASMRLKRSDNTHTFPTAIASYFRAWDRIACYRAAKKLAKDGCEVLSYGNGQISMIIPDYIHEAKMIEAYELGLTANLDAFSTQRQHTAPLDKAVAYRGIA